MEELLELIPTLETIVAQLDELGRPVPDETREVIRQGRAAIDSSMSAGVARAVAAIRAA